MNTGFIGGASTKINKNLLLFFGDLSCHPSQKEIRKFCYMRDVEVETLPGKLTDIGGIVPIMEKRFSYPMRSFILYIPHFLPLSLIKMAAFTAPFAKIPFDVAE